MELPASLVSALQAQGFFVISLAVLEPLARGWELVGTRGVSRSSISGGASQSTREDACACGWDVQKGAALCGLRMAELA